MLENNVPSAYNCSYDLSRHIEKLYTMGLVVGEGGACAADVPPTRSATVVLP